MEETLAIAASSSSSSEERSERRRPPGPSPSPWLVYPYTGKGRKDQQAFYNISDPTNKTYRKYIPELSDKLYWQYPSHQGWVVILCHDDKVEYTNWNYGDCFLWNPASMETIQLPTLLHWLSKSDEYDILNCVLSSAPGNPDSVVFFLFNRTDGSPCEEYILVYCNPRDKEWRKQVLPLQRYSSAPKSLFCFLKKLHVDCYNNHHLEIEIKLGSDRNGNDNDNGDCYNNRHLEVELKSGSDRNGNDIDDEDDCCNNRHLEVGLKSGSDHNGNDDDGTLSIRWLDVSDDILSPIVGDCPFPRSYYVESCDELFKVIIVYDARGRDKEPYTIQVLRMNLCSMAWEEVKSLGDHVLFLGERTTSSSSAVELGLTKGYVYFIQPNDKSLYRFDMENGTVLIDLPCPNLPTPWLSPNWMVIPTMDRVADGRHRTGDIVIEGEENKSSITNDEVEEPQKKIGGELEEAGILGILNEDVLKSIATYLYPVDYLHFRGVCKANRSMLPASNWRNSFSKKSEIVETTTLSPWLVFSKKNDGTYDFLDPMHIKEKYMINLHDFLLDATIRFSKGGWLLMSRGYKTLFFFNPFTRAMIQLPDLPEEWDGLFPCFSFSSSPTSSNCTVFAIAEWSVDSVYIFYISRGPDDWSYALLNNTRLPSAENGMKFKLRLNNAVFYDGVFYCLDSKGTLGVFDLEDDLSWKVLANPQRPCINSLSQCFLVECDGKLLSVFVGRFGELVQIFRLDFSKMVWVKVASLGKHMLFISNTSCISAIASVDRMENKIYFPRYLGKGILFYCLDTGRYHSLGSQDSVQDFYNTEEQLICSWIEPNWSQTSEQALDWLSV